MYCSGRPPQPALLQLPSLAYFPRVFVLLTMNSSVVFAVGAAAAAVGLWWRNANKPEACADDSDAESCDGAGYALGKRGITTNKCATPIAPYTQAIKANGMVFVSGMVGLTPVRLVHARAVVCSVDHRHA